MPATNTNTAPRIKLDSSPTPALEPKGRCSRFFASWMATPYTGPREKVPSRAGRSEMSSLINEGIRGMANSTNCSTAATAVSMAATARRWVFCFCVIKKYSFQCVEHPETVFQGARIKKSIPKYAVHAFSHPDYTVGTGIAPVRAAQGGRLQTILPVGNHTPPRRQIFVCSLLKVYTWSIENASKILGENLHIICYFYKKDFTKSKMCSIISGKERGCMCEPGK